MSAIEPGDMVEIVTPKCGMIGILLSMMRRTGPLYGERGAVEKPAAGNSSTQWIVQIGGASHMFCHCELRKIDPDGHPLDVSNWDKCDWKPSKIPEAA